MVLIFFWQCIEHHFVGMQWKSCTLCIIRHEGLQLCFGWLNWWIESLQSLVTPGFPMAKFGKLRHYMLVTDWGYSPSQVHSADSSRSTRNGATFRSIHLQIHLAVQDVRRAARHQLPRLTCDRWGTQDLGDGSNLIVICLGVWKSIKTS